ncbi:MAG: 8-amino-7-oxononanoate synthase [Planctomycetes bacterium]|nr:8-amino-7-oxononanoate synthase [Planctomycetota bacterium]
MVPEIWQRFFKQQRDERESRKQNRKLRSLRHMGSTRVQIGSHELINFSSNDYLGLAGDMRVAEAAASAAGRFGWGTGASRLVTGSSTLHNKLEGETAAFRGTEAALVFGSGYQANLGVITALVGKGDTVLSDAMNHASIVAGCRLSGATIKVFKHRDYDELERKLGGSHGKCLVVTDSLFSIQGDAAELPRIVKLCERFKALLLVDDAHANACIGKRGRGLPEEQSVLAQVPIVVGTYSKALGSYGGFVACSEEIKDHLVNHSRPFIYTTAMPIALAAANIEALKILRREGDALRLKLQANVKQLRSRLDTADFKATGKHHIVSIPLGTPDKALYYAEQLEQQGLLCYPMRWPSVPEGQDALRISVSAAHTEDELNRLVAALRQARDRAAGKDTANLTQRSARRPTHQALQMAEPETHGDEDLHAELEPTISAVDSSRLPNPRDLEDFSPQPTGSGDTIIMQPGNASAASEDSQEWPDFDDDESDEAMPLNDGAASEAAAEPEGQPAAVEVTQAATVEATAGPDDKVPEPATDSHSETDAAADPKADSSEAPAETAAEKPADESGDDADDEEEADDGEDDTDRQPDASDTVIGLEELPVSESGKTLAPEPDEFADPVIANIEGSTRRRKRNKTKTRHKSRTRSLRKDN